ncbi:MAG: hypothetical protein Q7O66_12380 [Dehalococcoidia bacterium]|nr:hypothetical protein [Dehalococcoidia bacterium]
MLRRATLDIPSDERRWSSAPKNVPDVYPLLRQMQARGEIKLIRDVRHMYEVTVPYAPTAPLEENEILMETNPYAALSHLSALVFHSLTDDLPKEITALNPSRVPGGMLPPGTDKEDWEGISITRGSPLRHILRRPVQWVQISPERYFGTFEYRPHGYPIRVTTPERTLLDGLQQPHLCGGFENVLHAWVLALDTINLEELVYNVYRFDTNILCQRVGFIMDELGLSRPEMEGWLARAKRGGSSKLVATAKYANTFSARWNLSINAPIDALHEGQE